MSLQPNNLWDERYRQQAYAYGNQPNDFLSSQISYLPIGKALSLGEGQGRNAVFLAKLGYSVTAVDASAVGLEQAQAFAAAEQVQIQTIPTDLSDYVIPTAQWDLILSIYCHLPSIIRKRVYRQIYYGLQPGGVFLLEAFVPAQLQYQTGGPGSLDMLASLEDLKMDLLGLEFIIAQESEREVREGLHHSGLAAVVQILAKKPALSSSRENK